MFEDLQEDRKPLRLRLAKLLMWAGVIALLLIAAPGPGYRMEWLDLQGAFTLLRVGGITGIAVALLALVLLLFAFKAPQRMRIATISSVAILLGAIAATIPYGWQVTAQSVPPIHDITTDTEDPPAFVDIAPLREDAPNPVDYPGEETAEKQRDAYPDLETLTLDVDVGRVIEASTAVAEAMSWDLIAVDAEEGRLEATATTRWFGFQDDVVIRVRPTDEGSDLDIRSKSRVGRSDVGKNAERIRTFRDRLLAELED